MDQETQEHDAGHIANALIPRGIDASDPHDPLQVIKMTGPCHGWMPGLHHRPVRTGRGGLATWSGHPVVHHGVERYGRNRVSSPIRGSLFPGPDVNFDPLEEDPVDHVVDVHGKFSGICLSMVTHVQDSPWHMIRNREGRNAVIPDSLIEDHFAAAAADG